MPAWLSCLGVLLQQPAAATHAAPVRGRTLPLPQEIDSEIQKNYFMVS